jgi:portal protein
LPFLDRLREDREKRGYGKTVDPRTGPQPPGRFSFGTQLRGGPRTTDAFGARQAPSPPQLVEKYHALIYAMANKNRDGCSAVPIRLMSDSSKINGKANRITDPIPVSRSQGIRAAEMGLVSKAAVDRIEEIRNHQLVRLLDQCDPYGTFTKEQFVGLNITFADIVGFSVMVPEGNGWDWEADRDGINPNRRKGPPEYIWFLYPQWDIPTRTGRSPIVDTHYYFADRIPAQSVLWYRHNLSIVDAYGAAFGPTYAGEPYRQQEQELVSILSQALGIAPRPSVVFTAKDALQGITPTQKETLEADLKRKFASYGAGGLYVNDGSFDVHVLDYPKADVGGMQIAQHDRDNMASIFSQPPTYYTVDSNLANLQAADKQFARFSIEPRLRNFCSLLTKLARACDERLFFMHDEVVKEDEKERAEIDKIYVDMGAVTIDQLNEEKKYPPVPWGKEPMFNKNMLPYSMLIAQTQQGLQQAQEKHDMELDQGEAAMANEDIEGSLAVDSHEHGKNMDKKNFAASQKEQQERSIRSLQAEVLDMIKTELSRRAS